jgi:NAD(P)-dependent dehydrogenase (short-subunit alcohol dehydrogenase family)
MAKVAVVTGSSSGIGFETSLLLARNAFETYATMRNLKKSIDLQEIAAKESIPLKVLSLDVNNDTSVSNAIDTIVKENGRIDVLVNNEGTGKWYNSKHRFSWWKNRINAISYCLSFNQVCCGGIYRIIKTRTRSI